VEEINPPIRKDGEPWPPGHYYSALPNLAWVRQRSGAIFGDRRSIPGIDLRVIEQLALAERFSELVRDAPFPSQPDPRHRYYSDNPFFGYADGLILNCVIRYLQPLRIVEVGSGFSSALILDTNDRDLGGRCRCTFIDPEQDRLRSLLSERDLRAATVVDRPVQDVSPALFSELDSGDVLFIDSSHVSKVGSDVNYLLLEVVPTLADGVMVHLHDILWPFEYLPEWVFEGRAWNESYLVRALLVENRSLEIVWFNHFLHHHHRAEVGALLRGWAQTPGGSLWLRTVAHNRR